MEVLTGTLTLIHLVYPVRPHPFLIPLPSTISPSTIQLSPEPSVALSNCTVEKVDLNCSHDTPSSSPSIPHVPHPLPPSSIPSFANASVVDSPMMNDTSTPSPPPNIESPDSINNFQAKWFAVFSENNWDQFSKNCDQFAEDVIKTSDNDFQRKANPAPRCPKHPTARPVNPNRRPLRYNPIQARRLQSLYRLSNKRAARKVLSDSTPSFDGTVDDANEFFTRVFGLKTCDIDGVNNGLNDFVPSGPADNHLADPLTQDKIKKKLRVLSNSAPGADRVEYRHLRAVDPNCKILCAIYNQCLEENDVPKQWKSATTILIHKKGDSHDVSNFCPIALMSCIYKLFMSIIANHLVDFAIVNEFLSDSQKSARPNEGCYEHTFLLQSLLLDAKRLQKNMSGMVRLTQRFWQCATRCNSFNIISSQCSCIVD